MRRGALLVVLLVLVGAGAAGLWRVSGFVPDGTQPAGAGARGEDVAIPPIFEGEDAYVYDISLHEPAALRLLLERLAEVAEAPRPGGTRPPLALVLHGPEVRLFARENYATNREIVDLAARLDAFGIIEVKMCQTKMRQLDIDPDQVPGFIEQVPFGPDEIERLVGEGYVYM